MDRQILPSPKPRGCRQEHPSTASRRSQALASGTAPASARSLRQFLGLFDEIQKAFTAPPASPDGTRGRGSEGVLGFLTIQKPNRKPKAPPPFLPRKPDGTQRRDADRDLSFLRRQSRSRVARKERLEEASMAYEVSKREL